ncbi:MAG: endonuclease MutS2 [bacterium]|jgi:DNA mismatch repair protein MutS2|nr:endonuclease MutS2 [bacterium]
MNQHTFQVLEFDKIKALVRQYAASTLGRDAVDAMRPFTHAEEVQRAQREVTEMVRLYRARQEPALDGIYDIRDILQKSQIPGAMLDPAEILLCGETVAAAARIQYGLKKAEIDTPLLKQIIHRLTLHPEIEKELARVFDAQKNIRDNATPALAKIRASLRQQRVSMIKRLEHLMRTGWKDYLQEDFYTNRDERYVLPVDARYQNKVKGIIHDRSATGTTVYIEPLELVEDGNILKGLQRDEEIEIGKILQALTAMIASHADTLLANIDLFKRIDFIAAKARFGIKYAMEEPKISPSKTLKLVQARHPLLLVKHGVEDVVALDLELDDTTPGLVISGPNTGGKTVVLKTVGLLVLMCQAGLPIPASPLSEIPIYRLISADIGDEQSLEQSLSTFSSHMKNIRFILNHADEHSLILIDELGSGTDPIEGGALSCAILEQLRAQNAMFIITTHLQELKLFAYQAEGIKNGSMEFDLQTLRPTFRFQMGLPGQSNAIRIAKRLGLPTPVIEKAQSIMQERGESPEDMLTKMGNELRQAENLRKKAAREAAKAQQQYEDNKKYKKRAEGQAKDILQRAEHKAQKLVMEMEHRLAEMEKREKQFQSEWKARLDYLIQQSSQISGEQSSKSQFADLKEDVKQTRKKLVERRLEEKNETAQKRPVPKTWRWNHLIPGARVRLDGISEIGTVTKIWAEKKEIEVQLSTVVLKVKTETVLEILRDKPTPKVDAAASVKVSRPEYIHNSCDIHGMTVEEMTPVVEKYLDDAFLSGQPYVYIVHGLGMGVLRRAVQNLLKANPIVRSYRPGGDYEGGMGVTVATLNSSIIQNK